MNATTISDDCNLETCPWRTEALIPVPSMRGNWYECPRCGQSLQWSTSANEKHTCPICGHEVSIRKVEESGGMDGRYENWEITCGNCNLLRVYYPADCFYGREYYETSQLALERFDEQCKAGQYVANAPTVGGWISVKDRLPEENGRYLVYVVEGYMQLYLWIDGLWFSSALNVCDDGFVTHWMLLPSTEGLDAT